MRLGDLDALKENIDKFIGYLDEDMIYRIKVVIDNAPTVTDRTEEVLSLQNTIAKLVEGIAEQEKLVIIRAKIMLDKVELQYFRDKFKKEYEEGLIVLPEYFEVTVHDVIRDVKIEGGST